MQNKIAITTDSAADMPENILERYGVSLIPLHIVLDGKSRRDGIEITPAELCRECRESGDIPKTSAVTIGEYIDVFKSYTDEGTAVVHLSLSAEISSTYQNACIAAAEVGNVYVVDSKSLCAAIGLLVIKACEMREQGLSAPEIAEKLSALRERVVTTFIIDKLDFLYKGGRCSAVSAFGANILGIKPSIEMESGKLSVGKKYRGKFESCCAQYVSDLLEAHSGEIDTDRCIIAYTVEVPDAVEDILRKEIKRHCKFKEVLISHPGCTITSHCGPTTAAVFFMKKQSGA
ncbi:MAG: DegV family protein [Clostridiales bacterium]|nr:DegV family protein [Clostridiales bacterium]